MMSKTYEAPRISVTRIGSEAWTDAVGASGAGFLAETDPYLLDLF